MDLESTASGAVFDVPSSRHAAPLTHRLRVDSLRILYVEDSDDVRDVVAGALFG